MNNEQRGLRSSGERQPRLLAVDVDGTLLDPDGVLRPTVKAAIAAVRSAGVTVMLATARSHRGTRTIASELGLEGPQLTMNGALFGSPLTGRVEWARRLPENEFHEHLAFARQLGLAATACFAEGFAIEHSKTTDEPQRLPSFASLGLRRVVRLEDVATQGPIRTFLSTPSDSHSRTLRAARSHFGGRASVVWADREGLELMLPRTSKGHGLRTVALSMGLRRADVAAIGDGPNDLEMLAWAGRSAAMANAPANVRQVASLVVPSSADDGIVVALRRFFPDVAFDTVGQRDAIHSPRVALAGQIRPAA